jgi:5-methylcytosine-specific restriction endonuclease McrA
MAKKRDYAKEYREYQGTPEQLRNQSTRHKARRKMGLKTGDPREVDHRVPLSKGGSNARSNLRVVSRRANRKKGAR